MRTKFTKYPFCFAAWLRTISCSEAKNQQSSPTQSPELCPKSLDRPLFQSISINHKLNIAILFFLRIGWQICSFWESSSIFDLWVKRWLSPNDLFFKFFADFVLIIKNVRILKNGLDLYIMHSIQQNTIRYYLRNRDSIQRMLFRWYFTLQSWRSF